MLLVLPLFLSATMTFVNGILAKNGIWRKNSFLSHFFFFFSCSYLPLAFRVQSSGDSAVGSTS